MTDCLIIFTRYPEPGQAKTRLIPALGADGAANLHRQMAEHTIAQARGLRASRSLPVEIRFAGGDPTQMQTWLGDDLDYQIQGEGDLGDRMFQAFETAFQNGNSSVVIIGTDCPNLDGDLLEAAFQKLQHCDLVLGPAIDGGYYLIGLRRFIPELFVGITWSTAAVLSQTIALAKLLDLSIAYLPTLSDIDRPEDLKILEPKFSSWLTHPLLPTPYSLLPTSLSIIIPVLNEANYLTPTLTAAQAASKVEIIVVDGGSRDTTVSIAETLKATVIVTQPGRAIQMNAGAIAASGDILLFLHGDTRLPPDFDSLIRHALTKPSVIAGAFQLRIDGADRALRLVEWGVNQRSRLLQLPYGDQAIFLQRNVFTQIGGFPDLPIMEDFELVCRLRRLGKIAIVPAFVLTSGRRWQKLGVLKTTVINQLTIAAYLLGIPPTKLARWYRHQHKKQN